MNTRHIAILETLNEYARVKVGKLSEELGVSTVTIRKDLEFLENKGLLKRLHGYAVRISSNDVGYRMSFDYEIKKRIATYASSIIEYGETIMIESGSSCALLANELSMQNKDVTIITSSIYIAYNMQSYNNIKIILLGGELDYEAQVTTGALLKDAVEHFLVDKFFMGVDGYNNIQGFASVDMQRAEAVRWMSSCSNRAIVLTDSSKFNRTSVVSLINVNEVDMVITDSVPDDCKEELINAGVEIILV